MTIDDIIKTIRDDHGGAWWALFHVVEGGHRFLPTGHVLTPAAYAAVLSAFNEAPAPEPTATDRRRNDLRAKAIAKGGGHV